MNVADRSLRRLTEWRSAKGFRVRTQLKPYLLLLPAFFFLTMFTYYPMVKVLRQSMFTKPHGERAEIFVGAGNYARMFRDMAFQKAMKNNGLYALGTVVPSIVLALALALLLNRSNRFNNFIRSLFFFPTLIPLVAAAGLWWFFFFPGYGLLDYYLAKLGFSETHWLGDSDIALYSLMLLTVWKNAGYYMVFFLAGLQGIPQDVTEAAVIEGANWWQQLRYVTLPLLRPTTAFVLVIAFMQMLSNVDHVIVMTKGGPQNSTNLLLFYIYQNLNEFYDVGKASAATVLNVVILLAVSIVGLRVLERGIHYEI
ncbi:MAG: sugar ABC transporter permease [Deltaproteobacteria bacterium]|nr:sugar ABC transporter permease [Deltaproteobacteria bacterium]MBW2122719.1 sugar ABC transporter permease [Deltaproteobacteria bacterium]